MASTAKTQDEAVANASSNAKKPSELYLNDKSMYKKESGSVCEFLLNKLNRQEKPTSLKLAEIHQPKVSSSQQTDLRQRNPPLKAEMHDSPTHIEETTPEPPVAPARNKIKRLIPVSDTAKRNFNNEAIKQAEAVAHVAERSRRRLMQGGESEAEPSSSSPSSSSSAASPNACQKALNKSDDFSETFIKGTITSQARLGYSTKKYTFPIVNHYDNNIDGFLLSGVNDSKNDISNKNNRNGIYIDFESQDYKLSQQEAAAELAAQSRAEQPVQIRVSFALLFFR